MKRARKGFTLVELLIVIAIIGVLAASMSLSAGSATAAAKASTIYSNIRNVKTAAMLYQVQKGLQFKESKVDKAALKETVDIDVYNKTGTTTTTTTGTGPGKKTETTTTYENNTILYEIVKGVDGGAGAYIVCSFKNDSDAKAIAKALKGYKDIRIDDSDTVYTAGAFLYHVTPATADTTIDNTDYSYNTSFKFTEANI